MKKPVKILLYFLLTLASLLLVFLLVVYPASKIVYHEYFSDSERCFTIPGLSDGFVQQGFHYDEVHGVYLVSGYMKDKSKPSRIYVVHPDGTNTHVELTDESGAAYTGHCGGVCVNGDYVYLSSDADAIVVFSLTDVLAGGEVKKRGQIEIGEHTSYCTFVDGYLVTGVFYRAGSYETPDYHHVATPAGDENTALVWVYPADETAPFGIAAQPVAALSVQSQVQGLTVTDDGKIVLSTSWGLNSSGLWLYEIDDRAGSVTKDGVQIPLYYLDSANLVKSVKAPPMAEELVCRNGRVYVMTESACSKYFFGNLIDGRHVFAYKF